MPSVQTFFRHCPSCGRRFEIRLVNRKLDDERRDERVIRKVVTVPGTNPKVPMPIALEQDVPITVDVEEFEYSYRCKHCGHEWIEVRVEEKKLS